MGVLGDWAGDSPGGCVGPDPAGRPGASGRGRIEGALDSLGVADDDGRPVGEVSVLAPEAFGAGPLGGIGSIGVGLNRFAWDFSRPPTRGGSLSALASGVGEAVPAAALGLGDAAGLGLGDAAALGLEVGLPAVGKLVWRGPVVPGVAVGIELGIAGEAGVAPSPTEWLGRLSRSVVILGVAGEVVASDVVGALVGAAELVVSADEALSTLFDGASAGGVASDCIFARA